MSNLFGTNPNQVPLNSMLGNLAFQDKAYVNVDKVGIGTTFVDSGTSGQTLQVYDGGAFVSGSVGIGTTNPAYKLDVIGDVRVTGVITAPGGINAPLYIDESEDDNAFYNIPFLDTSVVGGDTYRLMQVDAGGLRFNPGVNVFSVLSIQTPGDILSLASATAKYGIAIVNNGDVGIGTTNPTRKLDVDGSARIRGGLYDFYNNVGAAGSVLISTGAGISWTSAAGSGSQGIQGLQGLQGLQGTQGPSGPVGSSFTINNLMVLLYSDETESSGSSNTNSIKSYTVAANTHNYIIVESEVGIDATAADAEWSFALVYGGVTKETIPLRIANAGTGDQFKLRATLKYAEAFAAGGTVQINVTAVGTAAGTWAVHSFRVYGVDDFLFGAGPQGIQGLQGLQGPQGLQGLQGHQGTQGLQGLQGTQGRQGIQGLQGPQATQGLQGPQATQGLQGSQGIQGIQGIQGPQATQGLQGVQGPQATQGLQGLQGPQATQGLQGLQGIPGFGDQGVQGPQGLQGNQGVQGSPGITIQGISGSQGLQGLQGTIGIQGLQGTQGTFGPPTIPASSSTTAIVASDNGKLVVIAGGITIDDVFNVGENVVIYNNTASQQTITQGTNVTLRLGGTSLTGNRFVQQRGLATVICTTGNEYVISGAGVT